VRADRLIRQHYRDRYLVTLTTGEAFEGVLIDLDPSHIILADAESVRPDGERIPVDGRLWLPRTNVLYMQQPKG
jgi:hypothetical protein